MHVYNHVTTKAFIQRYIASYGLLTLCQKKWIKKNLPGKILKQKANDRNNQIKHNRRKKVGAVCCGPYIGTKHSPAVRMWCSDTEADRKTWANDLFSYSPKQPVSSFSPLLMHHVLSSKWRNVCVINRLRSASGRVSGFNLFPPFFLPLRSNNADSFLLCFGGREGWSGWLYGDVRPHQAGRPPIGAVEPI